MPSLGEMILADREFHRDDFDADYQPEAWADSFTRTKNGNLFRRIGVQMLTVFENRRGFAWCISTAEDGPEFSTTPYESESEALESLYWRLSYIRSKVMP